MSVMQSARIYSERNGSGQSGCRSAVLWRAVCGRFELIYLPAERRGCLYALSRGHRVALHGFIKKTRATPDEDLALARKRQKELEQ
jgi:hypothetical protein